MLLQTTTIKYYTFIFIICPPININPKVTTQFYLLEPYYKKKVDGKKPSMIAWLTVDEEGQKYAHNQKYHTEKGKRNIRTNCLKLYNKIAAWRSQEKDSSGHCKSTISD